MADRAFFCRIPSSCHRQYSGTSCFTTSTGNSGCCPNQEAILTPNGYSCCDMWLPISFMMPSCNRTPLRWRHNGHDSVSIYSQITSPTIVYSTVYSNADQRKHQSSASLAFVRGIHRGPVNSPHKWPQLRGNVSIWWRHHAYVMNVTKISPFVVFMLYIFRNVALILMRFMHNYNRWLCISSFHAYTS